ncbi:MAG: hypothetical protein IPJ65_41180 [Archangiaceae bacterium]|nr:hypothetical protein [Archangiaceae bacterium]
MIARKTPQSSTGMPLTAKTVVGRPIDALLKNAAKTEKIENGAVVTEYDLNHDGYVDIVGTEKIDLTLDRGIPYASKEDSTYRLNDRGLGFTALELDRQGVIISATDGQTGKVFTAADRKTDPALLKQLRDTTAALQKRLNAGDASLTDAPLFGMLSTYSGVARPSISGGDARTLRSIDHEVETHDQTHVADDVLVAKEVRAALAIGDLTADEAMAFRLKHKFPENRTPPGHPPGPVRGGNVGGAGSQASPAGRGGSPSGGFSVGTRGS